MFDLTYTFIGGGNMATALIAGLINNQIKVENIRVVEPNIEKRKWLSERYSIKATAQVNSNDLRADYIFLCVKPQVIKNVCSEIKSKLTESKAIIISVAAGITTTQLETYLETKNIIIRCMPNTPALIGLGATGIFSAKELDEQQQKVITQIFTSIGVVVWTFKEQAIDAITAISGSGPAYFFRLIEAMQSAAIDLGLSSEDAKKLVQQTALGAAQMAKDSSLEVQILREQVTSKGGTTAAALNSMNENNFDSIISNAIKKAHQRSIELANKK